MLPVKFKLLIGNAEFIIGRDRTTLLSDKVELEGNTLPCVI